MKKINFIFYNLLIITLIFIFIEVCFKIYFNQTDKFSCYIKVEDLRKYTNQKNCNFEERYFENKGTTIYYTNDKGERINEDNVSDQDDEKIFFIGDSFTFGYLSNYNHTYPYNAVKVINIKKNKKYREVNLGVNGYQFHQIIYLLKNNKKIQKSKNLIIYGLTPNDLFDIGEEDTQNVKKLGLIDRTKNLINKIDLISIKFISSKILSNDSIYINIYNKRGSKAGYINQKSSSMWNKKYEYFEKQILNIPKNIKNRLVIVIVPQQIQIKLLKNNFIKDGLAFDEKILNMCIKIKIKCISKTLELAKNNNFRTHFTIDGHLFPESNKNFGELIGKEIIKILNNDE